MAYRRVPNIYTLTGITGEDGLEIRIQGLKIGKLRKMAALMENEEEGMAENLDAVLDLILEGAVSWNLEDESGPVELTREALEEFEVPALFSMLEKWMDQAAGVGRELGKDSNSGVSFPAPPLTMEAL